MEQRIRYFEQMKDRLETIDEGTLELTPGKNADKEKKPDTSVRRDEYIARVKSRLNAWISEFNKLETNTYEINLDEDCRYEIEKLDYKLSQGYEKLRNLKEIKDDGWDDTRKEADALWEEILSLFDRVRGCANGESVTW